MSYNTKWVQLGDYIEECDERNFDSKDYAVLGVNINKTFIPTLANIEGVNLSKYKVVRNGMFVFSGMQTGRDICIRIALYTQKQPCIISPAYTTFRIKDSKKILSEYLFIYFNRKESDRYGAFISDSSVRANLDWERFLDIQIPLPSIEEQQKVVNVWKSFREIKEQNEAIVSPLMQVCKSYIQELKREYKEVEIGGYIEECNERNFRNKYDVDSLRGVTSDGLFEQSKAKTDELEFDNYKIVKTGNFAYNPSRINLGSIALCKLGTYIISPMYIVFRIKEECQTIILPKFLNIWFRRSEFQRSTSFFVAGSVRDTFNFSNMEKVKIPLPPMDVQEKIVKVYNCATEAKRIADEADRMSREVCPLLIQHIIHN
jgi:type I restriction enzyme, S subunit